MKHLYVMAGVAAIAALAAGCSRESRESRVDVTEFAVRQSIMTADGTYRLENEADTAYLEQYVSVQWPEELGNADVSVLKDSLLRYCFGDSAVGRDVRTGIENFVCDTSVLEGAYATVVPVDTLPEDDGSVVCLFNNVTASMMEVDEEKVTYKVTQSSFIGGAHPFAVERPFTYDFDGARVLTLDNMFVDGGREKVMPLIVDALARQLDVPVDRLDRAGIFTSQLTYPGQPYIYNNVLYFHYNPYDIAPYSSGMIDVAVYPYEVESLVQPWVMKLFDTGM